MTEPTRFRALNAALAAARRILLTTPDELDGDCIGATAALAEALRRRFPEKEVAFVAGAPCPTRYAWLPGAAALRPPTGDDVARPWDLAVVLDGDRHRLGAATAAYDAAHVHAIVDHHRSTAAADYDVALLAPDAAATCELVYDLLTAPPWSLEIDRALAECLYAGIIYDTSTFRYRLTRPHTMRVAAALLETGLDFPAIVERVILDRPLEAVKLHARILARAVVDAGPVAAAHASGAAPGTGPGTIGGAGRGGVARAHVTAEDLAQTGATLEAVGGLVDALVFIEGVEAAVIAVEHGGGAKLGLRSRGRVDVSAVARALSPSGGGHARAAGAWLEGVGVADAEQRAAALLAAGLR